MRRLVAIALVGLSALALPRPAAAGASTDAALALGAFAVLNQLVRGETILHGLVGVVQIAEVLVCDPPGSALQQRNDLAKPFSRRVALSREDKRLDFRCELRVAR